MNHVVIMGGGVSGLSAAYRLATIHPSVRITILEKQSDIGGCCASTTFPCGSEKVTMDDGVHSFRTADNGKVTLTIVHEIGLQDELVVPSSAARANRFIWYRNTLQRLSLALVFRVAGLFPIFNEYWTPRRPTVLTEDESVHNFFSRRFSSVVSNVFVSSLVSGVFAGNSKRLSMKSAFRSMVNMEHRSGSILRDALWGSSSSNPHKEVLPLEVSKSIQKATSYTFRSGMSIFPKTLVRVLADKYGDRVRVVTNACALSLIPIGSSGAVSVTYQNGDGTQTTLSCERVICALPSHAVSGILNNRADPIREKGHEQQSQLSSWWSRGSVRLSATFERGSVDGARYGLSRIPFRGVDVQHVVVHKTSSSLPLKPGFGYLVPNPTDSILGVIYDSSAFPNRYPAGYHTFSVMLGLSVKSKHLHGSPSEALVHRALNRCCGEDDNHPSAYRVLNHHVWKNAIPQYTLGHDLRVEEIRSHVQEVFG
eukprot:PhF_6_TR10870/c0_g1_i1/m.17624/K00231/PPOX, hemY; protoporphyrinogen/coproporphyrinogen III oxidase